MNLSRDIERLQISITGLARILAQSYKTLAASLPMAGVYMCNLLGVLYAKYRRVIKSSNLIEKHYVFRWKINNSYNAFPLILKCKKSVGLFIVERITYLVVFYTIIKFKIILIIFFYWQTINENTYARLLLTVYKSRKNVLVHFPWVAKSRQMKKNSIPD